MIIALMLSSVLSISAAEFNADVAKIRIYDAVYSEHKCEMLPFYTEFICNGSFLEEVTYNSELDAYEVEVEFEEGFFLHAISYADGEVSVSYWSK